MLINNITELRDYIPASVTLNFGDIKPKIRQVEREIIIRIFGQPIYDRLTTVHPLTSSDTSLKNLLTEATALLALLEYIPIGQVQFDSAGIRIASTEQMKTAFEWQIDELKTTCSRQGWAAIESALGICEQLPAGTLKNLWTATETYTLSTQNLITNLRQFEQFAHLQGSRVMFNKLIPTITDQQDEVIIPAIGQSLFTSIMQVDSEEDPNRIAFLYKAKKYASKALAYLTLGVGFQDTLLILSDNGPLVIEAMQSRLAKAVKSAPTDLISAIATTYRSRGAAALKELIDYCQSVSDVLVEYQESPNFIAVAGQTDHIARNDPNWGIAFF